MIDKNAIAVINIISIDGDSVVVGIERRVGGRWEHTEYVLEEGYTIQILGEIVKDGN